MDNSNEQERKRLNLAPIAFTAVAATTNTDSDGYRFTRELLHSMARCLVGLSINLAFDPAVPIGEVRRAWVVDQRLHVAGVVSFRMIPAAAGMYLAMAGNLLAVQAEADSRAIVEMENIAIGLVPGNKDESIPPLVFKHARCEPLN